MPGDTRATVVLESDPAGTIASFVRAISLLPTEPHWVLVGGFAVNLRIAGVHRLTGDIDTVTGAQERLIELIADLPDAEKKARAKVIVAAGLPVQVDVMPSTQGEVLPVGGWERAFALARRWAIEEGEPSAITVVGSDGAPVVRGGCFVAGVPTLIALKTVALRGRAARTSRTKVGSDIHDLVRLTFRRSTTELAAGFASAPTELTAYVAGELARLFDPGADGPLSLRRLRMFSGGNVDAQSITLDDLSLLAELGRTLTS